MKKKQFNLDGFEEVSKGVFKKTGIVSNKGNYMEVVIKPLSTNQAWQGRRFKTKQYKAYEELLLRELMDYALPEKPYHIKIAVGFSNMASDWDNVVKQFQDILQKRYGFDDKYILLAWVHKMIVPKGQEFIRFKIQKYIEPIDFFGDNA